MIKVWSKRDTKRTQRARKDTNRTQKDTKKSTPKGHKGTPKDTFRGAGHLRVTKRTQKGHQSRTNGHKGHQRTPQGHKKDTKRTDRTPKEHAGDTFCQHTQCVLPVGPRQGHTMDTKGHDWDTFCPRTQCVPPVGTHNGHERTRFVSTHNVSLPGLSQTPLRRPHFP